jgi:hypothetical protein
VVTSSGNRPIEDTATGKGEWAFLVYRLPRVPSAPRISLWRSLRRLGAVLVGDGLVALPADARTIEHLQWLAAGIRENGGEASVWAARPTDRRDAARLVRHSRDAAEAEYVALVKQATEPSADGSRALRRLRRQLRAIESRDFFGAPSAERARRAVDRLAHGVPQAGSRKSELVSA